MLFVLLGTPTLEFSVIADVASAALRHLAGPLDRFAVNSRADLQQAWTRRASPAVLITSEAPDRALIELFRSAGAPVLVVLSDPLETVRSLAIDRGLDPLLAIRTATMCLSSLEPPVAHGDFEAGLMTVGRNLGLGGFAAEIAHCYGLAFDPASAQALDRELAAFDARWSELTVAEAARRQARARTLAARPDRALDRPGLSEADLRLARRALEPFAALLAGRRVERASWPVDLLMRLDEPGTPATGEVSLVGPARTLVYGPYMGLPAGDWRVELALTVAENLSGNTLVAQVSCLAIFAEARTVLPAEGEVRIVLDVRIDDPKCPTELRLSVEEGAIEGLVVLRDVTLTRRGPADRDHAGSTPT